MTQRQIDRFAPYIRLYSSVFAPLTLFALVLFIIQMGGGWTTTADVAFFGVTGSMLAGRWIGPPRRSQRNLAEAPPGAADFLQTATGTSVLCIAVWCVANVVGNYLLPG